MKNQATTRILSQYDLAHAKVYTGARKNFSELLDKSKEYVSATNENEKQGIIKWYDAERGFGFVSVDNDSNDVFLPKSSLIGIGPLNKGMRIKFDVRKNSSGRNEVFNITKIPDDTSNDRKVSDFLMIAKDCNQPMALNLLRNSVKFHGFIQVMTH